MICALAVPILFLGDRGSLWPCLFIGFFSLLFIPSLLTDIPALWRESNWILVVQPDGLWVNIRSCFNSHLPAGRTAVWIDIAEIVSLRKYVETHSTPGTSRGETTFEKTIHLQVELAHSDTEQLREALQSEHELEQAKRKVLGFISVSSKTLDYPVTLPHSNEVRIKWRGRTHVVPSIDSVLREVTLRGRAGKTVKDEVGDWQTLDDAALDELVRTLLASGDRISAAKLLVARRGLSLSEAMQHVNHVDTGSELVNPEA